jgi:hypothetical protein
MPEDRPILRNVVLDCAAPRPLAEFYRQLFGLSYRPGDEPPAAGEPDPRGGEWLVLRAGSGLGIAFQRVDRFAPPTWPEGPRPQQAHLDSSVASKEELLSQHERVLALGGRLLRDGFDDYEEPIGVYADPAGHPFCIFVAAPRP